MSRKKTLVLDFDGVDELRYEDNVRAWFTAKLPAPIGGKVIVVQMPYHDDDKWNAARNPLVEE